MALIECPECGKKISDKAELCPHCGYCAKRIQDAQKNTDEIVKSENHNKSKLKLSKKKIIWLSVGIILCFCVAFIIKYISCTVPNVVNKDIIEATKLLRARGIEYTTSYAYTENYDDEIVYSQSIKAYTIYDKSEKMILSVSKGRTYTMPDIVGKSIEDVQEQIKDMPVKMTYEYTDDIEKDIVIKTSVDAGKTFNNSSHATITVSSGLYQKVPDIKGMDVEEAKSTLEKLGLVCQVKEYFSDMKKGTVYKYTPDKYGDKNKTTVLLFVSKGSGIMAPTVTGLSVNMAKDKLSSAGFGCNVIYKNDDLTTDPVDIELDKVRKQDIEGLVEQPCDVTVTVNNPAIKVSFVNFSANYVGGIDTYISFKNISDKQIAYVTFNVKYYDRMGYPANCSIRNTSSMNLEYTGPLNPGSSSGKQYWDAVVYNNSVAAVMLKSATITFADNTKQELTYEGSYWYISGYYGGELHD